MDSAPHYLDYTDIVDVGIVVGIVAGDNPAVADNIVVGSLVVAEDMFVVVVDTDTFEVRVVVVDENDRGLQHH